MENIVVFVHIKKTNKVIRRILLSTIFTFIVMVAYSQVCLTNGITFNNQQEIDSFPVNYPSCDSIIGEVSISGDSIYNLDGLIQLTYIGGNLLIADNKNLKDIAGLGGLITIDGSLSIAANDSLFSLTGLNTLEHINGDFAIKGNDELISLSSEVFALDTIKGVFQITQNTKLTDLTALIGTSFINSLEVSNNQALPNLSGLESLNYLPGYLYIGNNHSLSSLTGLENLDSTSLYTSINGNTALENLDGLISLKKIGHNFNLYFNDTLTSIQGLKALNQIIGVISISGNNKLTSLEGLDSLDIEGISYLEIFFNRELEVCNSISVCEYISDCRDAYIYKNAGNCEYLSDVQLSCGLDSTSFTITESACDSISLYGRTFYESGIYTHEIVSTTGGCDTSIVLFLTIPKSDWQNVTMTACDSFIFNQDTLYESGNYTYFGTKSSGCDSIINLELTITHPTFDSINIVACLAANVNGFVYTESGDYVQDHFVNAGGCDSTLYINVTINDGSPDSDTINIEGCDLITYNNQTYFSDTTWTETFTNAKLCDSLVTTIIKVNHSTESILNITQCGFYILNGVEYSNSGTFEQIQQNAAGCDSLIILNLTIMEGSNSNVEITYSSCESYIFGSDTIYESGIYIDTLINRFGCDSVVTLNLTINEDKLETITVTACTVFMLNGSTYLNSGIFSQQLLTNEGCDSILFINLTILPGTSSAETINASGCGNISVNGEIYETSGVYVQNLVNDSGCDSTLTININIFNSFDTIINQNACGEFVLNGQTFTESGIYQQNFTTTNGCDSTYILNLIVGSSSDTTFSATACDAYILNSQSYTESGVYTQLLFNSEGCDSLITLDLTILDSSNMLTIFDIESCGPFTFNGVTYEEDGRYVQKFINSVGCDSSVQINLTIIGSSSDTIISSTCNQFTLNDSIYTESGTYIQFLESASGCDSLLYLYLTVFQTGELNLNETTCDSFVLNGFIYYQSGSYTQYITDENGCDSLITLNLSVVDLNPSITKIVDTLYATVGDNYTYLWIDCVSGEEVPGATSFVFVPEVNGSYACIVGDGSCKDTTECVSFISNTFEESNKMEWQLYPNPTNGYFNIKSNVGIDNAEVLILDNTGRRVEALVEKHQYTIQINTILIPGVYNVHMTNNGKTDVRKMIVIR